MTVLCSFSFILFLLTNQITAQDVNLLNHTQLVLTFMVHRHGDRTPLTSSSSIRGDDAALEQLIEPWGYGQLSNVGMRRGYEVGKFIRRRYNELLSATYNRSEIYVRSTDSTRTKMTVLTALAAVYPALGDTWSEDINWVPVPYTTVPARYDFNTAFANCPEFITAHTKLMSLPTPKMDRFVEALRSLSVESDFDLRSPGFAYFVYDLIVSEISLGVDLGDKINNLMPILKEAADVAIDISFGDDKSLRLQAGVLLNAFFDATAAVIAGKSTQRVWVYSAHDFNVYSFEAISRVTPRQGVPKYGSIFALELRRVVESGKYVVLPVYVTSPEQQEIYLPVAGCGDILCDLQQFHGITSKYLLTEKEWRTKCGYTEDFEVDTSNID